MTVEQNSKTYAIGSLVRVGLTIYDSIQEEQEIPGLVLLRVANWLDDTKKSLSPMNSNSSAMRSQLVLAMAFRLLYFDKKQKGVKT